MSAQNLRQSKNWFSYLETLKWYSEKTSSGIRIALLKTPLGVVVKIQRPQDLTNEDLVEIDSICRKHRALFTKIEPSKNQKTDVLDKHGYVVSRHPLCPPSTMFIDLRKSETELWNNVSRSGKYSIKRAKREGGEVSFLVNPPKEKLEEYYKVVQDTGKQKHFYTEPIRDLYARVNVFKDNAIFGTVTDEHGKLMGIKFFLLNEGTATFLLGGTTREGRKGKWGYALLWESILYLKKQGLKYLDLEGVDDRRFPLFTSTWGGFSHFKEKFGGEIVRYPPPYIKYLNPVFKILSKFMRLPF